MRPFLGLFYYERMIIILNLNNIITKFAVLAKLTASEAAGYSDLVSSAKAYFEKLMTRVPASDSEAALCEYACACRAYYDYALLLAATESTYSTKTGGVLAKNYTDTVINAERFMKSAAAALPDGIFAPGDFVFEAVEG